MVDSDNQIRYHEWVLQQLRKVDEKIQSHLQLNSDQYKEPLVDRHSVDSDWFEG